MGRQFEKKYRLKTGDNLGDPSFWNLRLEDIDLRLAKSELALDDLDAVANRVEGAALDRINNVVTPIVVETQTRIRTIAELFHATSATPEMIGLGTKTFVVDEGQRQTFAAIHWVNILPLDHLAQGMTAQIVSFDRSTGALTVLVQKFYGSGDFAAWSIFVCPPPELQSFAIDGGNIDLGDSGSVPGGSGGSGSIDSGTV